MVNRASYSSWLAFLNTVRTERFDQVLALRPLLLAHREGRVGQGPRKRKAGTSGLAKPYEPAPHERAALEVGPEEAGLRRPLEVSGGWCDPARLPAIGRIPLMETHAHMAGSSEMILSAHHLAKIGVEGFESLRPLQKSQPLSKFRGGAAIVTACALIPAIVLTMI